MLPATSFFVLKRDSPRPPWQSTDSLGYGAGLALGPHDRHASPLLLRDGAGR